MLEKDILKSHCGVQDDQTGEVRIEAELIQHPNLLLNSVIINEEQTSPRMKISKNPRPELTSTGKKNEARDLSSRSQTSLNGVYKLNNTLSQLIVKNQALNSSVSKNLRDTSRCRNIMDSIERFDEPDGPLVKSGILRNDEHGSAAIKSLSISYSNF